MTERSEAEERFLADYDPAAYPRVGVTVDVVALTILDRRLNVLLVQRAEPPFADRWALPGGFIKTHTDSAGRQYEETLEQAAARELAEETGLLADNGHPEAGLKSLGRVYLEQLATYGDPDRDPRMRVVTVAYLAFAPELPTPRAGSDAAAAAWVPVDELGLPSPADLVAGRRATQRPGTSRRLAFDHARILVDGLERARSKLEYTPLATAFVDQDFTIGELREVYETVWGERLHAPNFRRKVLSVPGFVESAGATTERGGARGGPRSQLYHAGDARLLHPALLRSATEEQIR
ncbi:MAG TPA: NUDIX domain-containing protein [Actinomycetes bacterium]|nr:NUDIX domain-containing protein [Actinomycetes bacterium]